MEVPFALSVYLLAVPRRLDLQLCTALGRSCISNVYEWSFRNVMENPTPRPTRVTRVSRPASVSEVAGVYSMILEGGSGEVGGDESSPASK